MVTLGQEGLERATFGELGLAAHKIAGWLSTEAEGDERTGILLPNSLGFAAAFFASLVAGRAAVPLNYALAPREVEGVARDAGLRTLLTFTPPPGRASRLFGATQDHLASALPNLRQVRLDDPATRAEVRAAPFVHELPDPDHDAPAAFIYTSGSTGKPKGVVLSHGNLASNLEDIAAVLGIGPRDAVLGVLPLFHSFGLTAGLLFSILNGARFVPVPAFEPRLVLETVRRAGVTVLELVPSMIRAVAAAARRLPDPGAPFETVRLAVSGGAPLPAEAAAAFAEVSGLPVHEGYGASETSPVISFNPPDRPPAPGTVGFPLPQVEVSLRDDDDGPTEGEGEIWVRGPSVFSGYHDDPEASAAALAGPWYRTGDMGRWDPEGRLIVCGRKKRMIIVGGENVYPAEIEDAATGHLRVAGAVAVGMPDQTTGEAPLLYVETEGDDDGEGLPAELASWLRAEGHLAAYKLPKRIEVVESIPLLPTGKPDVPALLGERDPIANEALR